MNKKKKKKRKKATLVVNEIIVKIVIVFIIKCENIYVGNAEDPIDLSQDEEENTRQNGNIN